MSALGDLPPSELRAHLHRMADWVADYREHIERRQIVPTVKPGEIAARMDASLPDAPESITTILDELDSVVMSGIVHWGHPAFLGYFGSTSNGPALLGEIAAAALNVSAMTWKTSPAATELETVVLGWIREMIALPESFAGVVYDTASVAVLHALAAAREVASVNVRTRGMIGRDDLPVLRAYASDQAHSSLEKAMVMLGLGEQNVVRIPSDPQFRMSVPALRTAMDADIEQGMKPFAVIATVGTTSSASVDPVREISQICRERKAWLHVDAAYGGAMAVLPEGTWAMDGAAFADSLVINPHKWMFVPLDFSALFTPHPEVLRAVFALTPEYLRGDASPHGNDMPAASGRAHGRSDIDYMDYGIQLGRRFRALKAWMAFRALGRDGIASRIREHCRLAAMFADLAASDTHVELAAPQQMGVVCFRFVPPSLDDEACDVFNENVVEKVNATGVAYLTHTTLGGRVCVRAGFGNVLTTEEHVAQVWSKVKEAADLITECTS